MIQLLKVLIPVLKVLISALMLGYAAGEVATWMYTGEKVFMIVYFFFPAMLVILGVTIINVHLLLHHQN